MDYWLEDSPPSPLFKSPPPLPCALGGEMPLHEAHPPIWTDDTHSMYLDHLESTFVGDLYHHVYCQEDICGMPSSTEFMASSSTELITAQNLSTKSLASVHPIWQDQKVSLSVTWDTLPIDSASGVPRFASTDASMHVPWTAANHCNYADAGGKQELNLIVPQTVPVSVLETSLGPRKRGRMKKAAYKPSVKSSLASTSKGGTHSSHLNGQVMGHEFEQSTQAVKRAASSQTKKRKQKHQSEVDLCNNDRRLSDQVVPSVCESSPDF